MKSNIVADCLKKLYIRHRKKTEEYFSTKYFEAEVKLATKDLYLFSEHEIPDMFSYAYKHYEGKDMPLIKDIIALWEAFGGKRMSFISCPKCVNGYISAYSKAQDKWLAFICSCASNKGLVGLQWDEYKARQAGFISEEQWKSDQAI